MEAPQSQIQPFIVLKDIDGSSTPLSIYCLAQLSFYGVHYNLQIVKTSTESVMFLQLQNKFSGFRIKLPCNSIVKYSSNLHVDQ